MGEPAFPTSSCLCGLAPALERCIFQRPLDLLATDDVCDTRDHTQTNRRLPADARVACMVWRMKWAEAHTSSTSYPRKAVCVKRTRRRAKCPRYGVLRKVAVIH